MNDAEEFDDFVGQRDRQDLRDIRLPRIDRMASRGAPKEVKSSTKLPTLRSETVIEGPEAETEHRTLEPEEFLGQVERKLRMIMEEQKII